MEKAKDSYWEKEIVKNIGPLETLGSKTPKKLTCGVCTVTSKHVMTIVVTDRKTTTLLLAMFLYRPREKIHEIVKEFINKYWT